MTQTPNVFTYPRNEPGTLGHLDLVEPLRAFPEQVDEALKQITREQARFRAPEGGWCIQEIVGHLRDNAEVEHKRLYMMSTQTDPVLEPYDPDALAAANAYLNRDLRQLSAELAAVREKTVRLLTTLVNWNWARTGQHRESGRMSIRQLVEYLVEHEAGHLAELRRLRVLGLEAGV